jgi:hypothetical protein
MYDTLKTQSILQLGMLSLVPYLAELVLEHGLVRTLAVFLQQVVVVRAQPGVQPSRGAATCCCFGLHELTDRSSC